MEGKSIEETINRETRNRCLFQKRNALNGHCFVLLGKTLAEPTGV